MSVRTRRDWFTSSYSSAAGSCVEVRFDHDVVLVRDSKNRADGRLVIGVPGPQWTAFVERVREW
ncbi:DUF397 domain-containing protein [Actinophytocola gossypii]|uniref:DUF397 domain-containing protein n=1 Tax=Actinophytocola gossypii TaxID=2812003 RepID=A0ABT2J177_9PSEU|nr:DUF397 domain-containing protein [Actinophytocola gossypii]MCT2581608.1 DUF397 domain-containing protein [Actinophytocola gossypii]